LWGGVVVGEKSMPRDFLRDERLLLEGEEEFE